MAQTTPTLVDPRSQPRPDNPFATDVAPVASRSGMVAVEQQRAIAEVQARMIIAKSNPRDPMKAMDQILNDCTRPTLADHALYSFARGGTDITGPTIRIAEAIAQRWGNLASGIKEIARHDGYSECVAYAWDLETGFYDERQFQVRHWRDTKQGGYWLSDERDVYELIANLGQRRKRACLLTVIPGDVVEAAVQQCERTMEAKADMTPEGVNRMLEAFAPFGVTKEQIEKRIQRRLDAMRPAQKVMLSKIYNSIRDGMSQPGDWFGDGAVADEAAAVTSDGGTPSPQTQPAQQRGRGRPRRTAPVVDEAGAGSGETTTPPAPVIDKDAIIEGETRRRADEPPPRRVMFE